MEERTLFLLLRLGLGLSSLSEEDVPMLESLSAENWSHISNLAASQGVGAITADGIQVVYDNYPRINLALDKQEGRSIKYDWFGQQLSLEISNGQQISVMGDIAGIWSEAGIKMMVFKGQANGLLYPNPLHRSTGDIDCYLFDRYCDGNDLAAEKGAYVDTHWYKHSQIRYRNEIIENHRFFAHTRDGKKGKELNKVLCGLLDLPENSYDSYPDSSILLPPVLFNALFLTYHALAHFLSEGIRLKQVTDWVMFLKKEQSTIDWDMFNSLCDYFHFSTFLSAMNGIAVNRYGVVLSSQSIRCDSRFSEKMINSILHDDDYVFNSDKSAWRNRFHIIRNLFKYKWKYRDIYGCSIWKQLWYYVIGYMFHTEE